MQQLVLSHTGLLWTRSYQFLIIGLHLHILSFCSHLLLSFIVSDDHEAAKSQAQQNIQSLKDEIFNRDKAVCAFLDTTKDEGR